MLFRVFDQGPFDKFEIVMPELLVSISTSGVLWRGVYDCGQGGHLEEIRTLGGKVRELLGEKRVNDGGVPSRDRKRKHIVNYYI